MRFRWTVALCVGCSPTTNSGGFSSSDIEAVLSAAHLTDVLFDEQELPHFELALSDKSLASLRSEPYVYVNGTFVFNGERFDDVGVRTKGDHSWQSIDDKPSLKIKFNWEAPGRRFRGLEELTLNAMNDDHTMMHERVGYRLYRASGVPAARATHSTVQINDTAYGLYTHLETIDEEFIGRWFSDPDGILFELEDADYTSELVDGFELKYNGDDTMTAEQTMSNIHGAISALAIEDPNEALDAVSEHIDMDQFIQYWAVSAVIGQFDAYPYTLPGDDCHLYDDPSSGLIHTIPHGIDESFYSSSKNILDGAIGLLATTCLKSSDCTTQLEQHVTEVLDVSDAIHLHDYYLEVLEQITPLIEADNQHSHDPRDVSYYQDAMGDFIANRRDELTQQFSEYR